MVDPAALNLAKEFKHDRPLLACRCSPCGRFVCTGAHDSSVVRWRIDDGAKAVRSGHTTWVRAMAFGPGGELLVTGDHAGNVLAWRIADDAADAPVYRISAHQGWIRALAISPDGRFLATAGNDQFVRVWHAADGSPAAELKGHECHVFNVRFHPGGAALASADLKGIVRHWNTATWTQERQLDAAAIYKYDEGFRADIGGVRGMAFSNDGKLLACSGITEVTNAFAGVGNAAVVLLDWADGKTLHQLRPKENFQGVAWGVAFHSEGWLLGVGGGGAGGALWIWKPDQPHPVAEHKLPAVPRDLDLAPAGALAVACYDGAVRLYELSSAKT